MPRDYYRCPRCGLMTHEEDGGLHETEVDCVRDLRAVIDAGARIGGLLSYIPTDVLLAELSKRERWRA